MTRAGSRFRSPCTCERCPPCWSCSLGAIRSSPAHWCCLRWVPRAIPTSSRLSTFSCSFYWSRSICTIIYMCFRFQGETMPFILLCMHLQSAQCSPSEPDLRNRSVGIGGTGRRVGVCLRISDWVQQLLLSTRTPANAQGILSRLVRVATTMRHGATKLRVCLVSPTSMVAGA